MDQPAFQPVEHGKVKVIGRLVEQKQSWMTQQQTSQSQTSLLTAAESADAQFPRQGIQLEGGQDGLQLAFPGAGTGYFIEQGIIARLQGRLFRCGDQLPGEMLEFRFESAGVGLKLVQVFLNRHLLRQIKCLWEISHLLGGAGNRKRTGIGRDFPDQDAQQRAFTAAVGPDQADLFAGVEIERNIFQYGLDAERFTELVNRKHKQPLKKIKTEGRSPRRECYRCGLPEKTV